MEISRIETQKIRLFFIVIWSKKNFLATVGQICYAATVFRTGRFLVKLGKYAEILPKMHGKYSLHGYLPHQVVQAPKIGAF